MSQSKFPNSPSHIKSAIVKLAKKYIDFNPLPPGFTGKEWPERPLSLYDDEVVILTALMEYLESREGKRLPKAKKPYWDKRGNKP